MLKVLIIPAFRLYPVDSGGAHAQLAFLEKLQHRHETDIIITPDNVSESEIPSFRARFPELNPILTGYAPLSRWQKFKAFLQKTSRKFSGKDHSYELRKHGLLNGLIRTRPALLEEIKRIAAAKDYDIIQAEHSLNLGIIEILPVNPKKVFVHHEIAHTRIQSDMISLGYSETYSAYISGIAWHLEKNWLSMYDGIITLCHEDAALLQLKGTDAPIQVAQPFALFENELRNVYNAALPPALLFVGSESHYPNKEGLSWFMQEVYPLVRKQYPDCRIRITGNWSNEYKSRFANDRSVQFAGFVQSLDEVYKDSILIAPVRIGSGVRIKVITALAQGVPVAGTAIGLSGIPGIADGLNAMIADDAAAFAQKILLLLNNAEMRGRMSQQGFQLAKDGYREGAFAEDRTAFYQELMAGS